MAEDLSQWVEYAPDGTPKVKPGIGALPPMNRAPAATSKATTGKATTSKATEPKRKATGDRFRILNAFVDCSIAGLSRVELGTWLCLYRDTRNGTACTGQSDIARRLGVTDRAVKSAVRRLLGLGLLTLVYRGGLNRGPSRYRVEPVAAQPRTGKAPPRQTGERGFTSTGEKTAPPLGKRTSPIP